MRFELIEEFIEQVGLENYHLIIDVDARYVSINLAQLIQMAMAQVVSEESNNTKRFDKLEKISIENCTGWDIQEEVKTGHIVLFETDKHEQINIREAIDNYEKP